MGCRINKRRKYKLQDEGMMSLTFGTEDRMNPDVVCMTGKVWVSYNGEDDCEKVSDKARNQTRREIHEWLETSRCFSDRMIFDFSIVASHMGKGIKKLLTVEVFLRRKGDYELAAMKDAAEAALRPIFRRMLSSLEAAGFEQQSGKRK